MTNAWYQVNGTSKLTGLGKNYNFSPSGVGDSWAMQNSLARMLLKEREAAHKDLMKERAYNQQAARFLSTGRQLLQQAMAAGYDPVEYFIEQRKQYQDQDFYKNADPELQKVIDAQWTAAAVQHADGLRNSKNYDKAQQLYTAFGVPGLNENLMKLRNGIPVDSLGGNFTFTRNADGTENRNEVELFGQKMPTNKAYALIAEAGGDLNALYRGFSSQALEDRLLSGYNKTGTTDATKTGTDATTGTTADGKKAGDNASTAKVKVPLDNEIGFTEDGKNVFNTGNTSGEYEDPVGGMFGIKNPSIQENTTGDGAADMVNNGGGLSALFRELFTSPGNPDVEFKDPYWKDPTAGDKFTPTPKSYSDNVNGSVIERLKGALGLGGDPTSGDNFIPAQPDDGANGSLLARTKTALKLGGDPTSGDDFTPATPSDGANGSVGNRLKSALNLGGDPTSGDNFTPPTPDDGANGNVAQRFGSAMSPALSQAQTALRALQNTVPANVGTTNSKATSNAYSQFGKQVSGTARNMANTAYNTLVNSGTAENVANTASAEASGALADAASRANAYVNSRMPMGSGPVTIKGAPDNRAAAKLAQRILSPAGIAPVEDTGMGIDPAIARGILSPAGVAPTEDTGMGIDPSVVRAVTSPAGVSPTEDTGMGIQPSAVQGAISGIDSAKNASGDWLQGVFDESTPSSRMNSAMVYAQQYQRLMQAAAQAQAAGADYTPYVQAASQLRDKVMDMANRHNEVASAIQGSQIFLDGRKVERLRELQSVYGQLGEFAAGKSGIEAENAKALQEQFKSILGQEASNASLLMPGDKLRELYGK